MISYHAELLFWLEISKAHGMKRVRCFNSDLSELLDAICLSY